MTFNELLALFSTLGVGTAVGSLAKELPDYFSGRAQREKEHTQREREHNQDLAAQRDRAWELVDLERKRADEAEAERDAAFIAKRRALELASWYRGRMLREGLQVDPWPSDLK